MASSTRWLLIFALLYLVSTPAFAQQQGSAAIITGSVVDGETGAPLPGAHVFIAVSMIGTTTDNDGRYRLENVPLGANRLYVSMLGFEPSFLDLNLRESRVYPHDFKLVPAILEAGEIVVEAKGDKNWKKRLEKFTRLFIGESPNSFQAKILNPEVLDFQEKLGKLSATASDIMIIENNALGYRIQYFLKDFSADSGRTRYDGEPLFEPMTPDSPEQAQLWEENRRKAFMGSFRHFMLALLADRTKGQGFLVFSRPSISLSNAGDTFGGGGALKGSQRYPLDPAEMLKPGEIPTEKIMDFNGFVEIVYQGEKEDEAYLSWQKTGHIGKPKYQTSWINLENGPTTVDYKGDIVDPYGVTFYGYLAFERVADELPKEYRPN